MSAKPHQHKTCIRKFIESLGQCTPTAIHNLFDLKSHVCEEIRLVASLTALCSLESNPNRHSSFWQSPLDAMVQDKHPLCAVAIQHMAEHAQSRRLKVEAIRRLGVVTSDAAARDLLRRVVLEGSSSGAHFNQENVSEDDFRIAALESIRELQTPSAEDSKCVIGAIDKESQTQQITAVFYAGIETLAVVAYPPDLKEILVAIEKVGDHQRTLQLLSVLAKFSKTVLSPHRKRLAEKLANALDAFRDEGLLRERLTKLATTVSCAELLRALPHYPNESFEAGRGAISAAAIAGYHACDQDLVDASLGFLRFDVNLKSGSPYILALQRCVEAGKTEMLRKKLGSAIVQHEGLIRLGLLVEVFGEVRTVVEEMSRWLDDITEPRPKAHCASICFVGIVNSALLGAKGFRIDRQLDNIRVQASQGATGPRETINAVAEFLNNRTPDDNPLSILAGRVVSGKASNGVISLAEQTLAFKDDLAHSFLERVLTQAACLDLEPGQLLDDGSCLNKCEGIFSPEYGGWLREHLPSLLLCDGKMNRYAVDLGLRKKLLDVSDVEKLLTQTNTAQDADFLVCNLASQETKEGFAAVARAVDFAPDKPFCSDVRKTAIEMVGQFANQFRSNDDVLGRLHARFQDFPDVRFAAYKACGSVAAYSSILPLKDRLASDTDDTGKRTIADALASIKERLSKEQPALNEVEGLVSWLGHVGNLGDQSLASAVEKFLYVPHSDSLVTIAALQCLGKLGKKESVGVIDEFVKRTSAAGDIQKASRQAKLVLQDRNDLEMFGVLSQIFEGNVAILDTSINYEEVFGNSRMKRIRCRLAEALAQLDVGHWDDFVTCLDGVCDILSRHAFEKCWAAMKLAEAKGQMMAKKDYANRLGMAEFKNTFPSIQPLLLSIHQMRGNAETAHAEDSDGSGKPGLDKLDADLSLSQFKKAFPEYIAIVRLYA